MLCILGSVVPALNLFPGFFRINTGIILVWSIYYFYLVNTKFKTNLYINGLNLIVLLVLCYGIALLFSDVVMYKRDGTRVPNYAYLVQYSASVLPIYSFYYFTRKKYISEKTMKNLFYIILLCTITIFLKKFFFGNTDLEDISNRTNNSGYLLVPLIPMLFFVKIKKNYKIVLLFVIYAFIIFSAKRGAILVGTVCVLIYYLYYNKKGFSFVNITISLLALVVMYFFVDFLADSSLAFQAKLTKTLNVDSSGREEIYTEYFFYYLRQIDPKILLFGGGADSTMRIFGFHAHNDWLEFLLSQGFIGVLAYAIYWSFFLYSSIKINESHLRIAALSLFISYFLMSFFSMSINSLPLAAGLSIGYCLAFSNTIKQ